MKKAFRMFFIATAGLVLGQGPDPAMAGKTAEFLAGIVSPERREEYLPD